MTTSARVCAQEHGSSCFGTLQGISPDFYEWPVGPLRSIRFIGEIYIFMAWWRHHKEKVGSFDQRVMLLSIKRTGIARKASRSCLSSILYTTVKNLQFRNTSDLD